MKKIRVLFIASGNSKNFDIVPFIKEQGDSLRNADIDVRYFPIVGKGLIGYLSNISKLRTYLSDHEIDIIHAHFVLSAWIAVLSFPRIPIVISLMGTDAYGRISATGKSKLLSRYLTLLTLCIQPFVTKIISKSPNIEKYVYRKKHSHIIPNGVDLRKFYPSSINYRSELSLDAQYKNILFLGNTNDPRKNYDLLHRAIPLFRGKGYKILKPYPIEHTMVFKYLNSVDLLVMCSLAEGSPNLVKEAMACNCKAVVTDVGDVRYLINNVPGYRISKNDPTDLANKIIDLLQSNESCKGSDRIRELELDIVRVAQRISSLYREILNHH
jgi:teichuronic acid biosynthesis glycosyltransferase TuaC